MTVNCPIDRQPRWVREEGLAFVESVLVVDATAKESGTLEVGGVFDGLFAQVRCVRSRSGGLNHA